MFNVRLLLILSVSASFALANPMRPDPLQAAPSTQSTQSTTAAPVAKPPRLPRLENILVIGELKKAFFNGGNEILPGESIGGYKVVQIETNYVVLQRGNTRRTIELKTPGELSISSAKEE